MRVSRDSDGMDPSSMDLFISNVTGFAGSSAPSLIKRAGIFSKPVDLKVLISLRFFKRAPR